MANPLGNGMPMTTALELPGLAITESLGLCCELVVRGAGLAGSVASSFKALRRGELGQYSELLSRHAALGWFDLDELERRVARVIEAQTREEADAVLTDLPPLPVSGQPPGRPRARRRHGHADTPRPDWTQTQERFRDPRSARIMRVWTDPDGGRHYVPDE
ncbi:MAG TPA: DUF1707 domain-containing protein [Solirubrobacteraceae bacterium]|jgi:uncharacterized protein YbjQ (UPF0145 family)|nr:DUF1707 domain-containing protein [Solirubrobacteraceae bacterium]